MLIWNTSCNIFGQELNHIQYELPNQIEMEDEYRISKVIIDKLTHDGWIKKFTETQETRLLHFIYRLIIFVLLLITVANMSSY